MKGLIIEQINIFKPEWMAESKKLWNQRHLHRTASILVASYVKRPGGFTWVVGLWNHVLIMIQDPLCPTPLAPKEMLQGGFGDFYSYEMLLGGWLWLRQWQEGALEMMKDPFKKDPINSSSSLSALDANLELAQGWTLARNGDSHQFPPCCCLQITTELWNQRRHSHRPASILVASYVKRPSGFTRVVGLWNHVLIMIQNPLCLTTLAPKEMIPPRSYFQGSVCKGVVRWDKINEQFPNVWL